jgi:hypothetical protein
MMAEDIYNSKDELYDLVVRVYRNYFDIDEVREMIKFYKTPHHPSVFGEQLLTRGIGV